MTKNKMKTNMRRVFFIYLALFLLVIVCIVKMVIFDAPGFVNNSYNRRLTLIDSQIKRGEVKDSFGNVLAESTKTDSGYSRIYNDPYVYAHTIGYLTHGNTGVEAAGNFEMQRLDLEIYQRIVRLFTGEDLKGNNVILTIDPDLQQMAYELLGKQKGAVIAIEPSTGRILAQAAYPVFDPNTITEKWSELSTGETSPLINRATQGLYTPGSVFKIVTALCAIQNTDWLALTYECKGEVELDEKTVHCFDSIVHGTVNLERAFAVSCNTFFATIGEQLGEEKLKETAETLYFNKPLLYELPYSVGSVFPNSNVGQSEMVDTAFGQGKTLVSPLQMAMITAAVANGGMLMKPYIIDHAETFSGRMVSKSLPEKLDVLFSSDEAMYLNNMMTEVVSHGTGTRAKIQNVSVGGKTGSAENPSGDDHAWFVGFAPAGDPKIAVAVILENGGKGSNAAPIAKQLMEMAIQK